MPEGSQDALRRAIARATEGLPPVSPEMRFELRRKVLHVVVAVIAVPMLLLLPLIWNVLIASTGVAVITITWAVERRRLPEQFKGPLHDELAGVLVATRRPHEDFPWSPVLYTASLIILGFAHDLLGLPRSIALAAYAILGLGDATSALVGVAYGRTKLPWNRRKSWEGTAAGLVAGLMGGVVMGVVPLAFAGQAPTLGFLGVVVVGAVAGSLAETMPRVEDNFVVPLAAAAAMFGAALLLGVALP